METSRYFDYPDQTSDRDSVADSENPTELGLLSDGDDADWALLFDYGDRYIVAAGETIIELGSTGRSLFIVLSGSFVVQALVRRRGRPVTVGTLEPGAIVGEVGFAVGGSRSHTVKALASSEVFELTWESFEQLAAVDPGLGVRVLRDVLRIVATRTRAAEQ